MREYTPTRGERWLALVFPFEPLLRSALSKSPRIESVRDNRESIVDELLCDTYARILTLASEPDFTPVCLKTFAVQTAREVAGEVPEPDPATVDDLAPILKIVNTLPVMTRRVFTLRKVYALPFSEIAAHLQLSVAEVETHLIDAALACTKGLFGRKSGSEVPRAAAH